MRRVLSSILMVLAVVATLVVVLVLVSTLATREGSSQVARDGQVAIMAESTLSSTSGVRNASVNALLVAQGFENGIYSQETLARAVEQLAALTDQHDERWSDLVAELSAEPAQRVSQTSSAFAAEVRRLIEQLEAVTSVGLLPTAVVPTEAYRSAAGALVDVRDDLVVNSLVEAEYAGQVADAVRFLVIVVIPIIAMLVLRSAMKRRRERETMQAELRRQSEVIESKDEFVANLSHELRTPLTGVYGFALALDEGALEDHETAKELTGLIVSEAGELSRMVDDLITAGQVETGNVVLSLEELELDPEIETVVDPFVRAGASINYSPAGHTAETDRQRFRQVVRNLVSNAVRHGGPNIEVFTEQGGGSVSVFVMDDGDGIDDDHLAKLFERYQHEGSDPLLEGSVGLGLAIARSLAVGMGGDLTYTRTNGITYFVFRVPSHRSGRLGERVDDNSLGAESATASASQVAKLFAR